VIKVEFRCSKVYLKVYMSEMVSLRNRIVIMQHVGIQEFTVFTLFGPFTLKSPF